MTTEADPVADQTSLGDFNENVIELMGDPNNEYEERFDETFIACKRMLEGNSIALDTNLEHPYVIQWACGRPMGQYRGMFPIGFMDRVNEQIAPVYDDDVDVLFPFGGKTPDRENWTINDIEPRLDVDTHYDATDLPDEWENKFDVVLADPPYADWLAESLYDVEYASPKQHMMEAARVLKPGGKLLILDWLVYMNWPDRVFDVDVLERAEPQPITCGPNTRIRVLNVFEKMREFPSA